MSDTPEYVIMQGQDFHNPERCVQTKVHRDNIEAFRASGWAIVEPAAECDPENIPVYQDVAKKEKGELAREPLEHSPQSLNTEPPHDEEDTATSDESNPKTIKKELKGSKTKK
jgi:hypothetical protein